jgi:hypothetical protein
MKRAVSKRPGVSKKIWSENQRLQAVVTYLQLGSLTETALVTSIPRDTLARWKMSDWWKEMVLQIRDEDATKTDSKLGRVIEKSLAALEDRIDNGNHQLNPRTGKVIRVPVSARDALKASAELLTKQEHIRNKPVKMEVEKTIDARLAKLAEEFMRFAHNNTKTEIDITPPPPPIETTYVTLSA